MSRPRRPSSEYVPLIALVHRLNRVLQQNMADEANRRGYAELKNSHNAVFATLDRHGSRPTDMAAQAGITRQSMGEVIRDMVRLGMLEMKPDPADKRAKLVTWTEKGLANAQEGYEYILALEDRFSEEFGAEEYQRIRDALERITEIVGSESKPGG
jgi:DNA-binding MarR family transcriptional regulator